MENIVERKRLVEKYIHENDKEAAVKLLFEMAVASARERDFEAAEAFRERILDTDPMALQEIIRSGEIIEEEKYGAINVDHLEVCSKLYKELTREETNALYFSLKHETREPDEVIYKQGEFRPRLYFMNSGRAKLVYAKGDREFLLKMVGPGQVVGEESFFFDSACTTSLIAVSKVELAYVGAENLKRWKKDLPVLESKLLDYASRNEKIADLLRSKEMDRRVFKRITLRGEGLAQLVTDSGSPLGQPFKITFCDVSTGGVCFLVRITKKEIASLLLGRRIQISYSRPPSIEMDQSGVVVGVRLHPFEDCTINVKFDSCLPDQVINELMESPHFQRNADIH